MLKSRYQNVLNGHMFAGPVGVHPPPPLHCGSCGRTLKGSVGSPGQGWGVMTGRPGRRGHARGGLVAHLAGLGRVRSPPLCTVVLRRQNSPAERNWSQRVSESPRSLLYQEAKAQWLATVPAP